MTFSCHSLHDDDYNNENNKNNNNYNRPLNFKINYEFVDLYQDGVPLDNDQGCNRKFVSSLIDQQTEPIIFRGIRNVFSFGRSGAVNLK